MSTNNRANAVSITQAAELMYAVVKSGFSNGKPPQNICLHSAPGTGKSAVTWQLGDRLSQDFGVECEVIDIRLSGMDSSDVQGIPYVADEGVRNGEVVRTEVKEMFFSTPAWWPNDPNKNYILFLDELMNAAPHVQHAAYRLILDRSVQNGKVLPDNVAIIAAGNRKEDKTGAKPLLPAAANRFGLHLEIDQGAAKDSFIAYAMNKGMDRTIVGYLSFKSESVYQTPADGESAFATPRSWEFADDHLKNEVIAGSDDMLRVAIAGAVGSSTAMDYMGFREYYGQLPDWNKIRSGKEEFNMPSNDEGLKYAVSSSMAFELLDAMQMEDMKQSTVEVDNLCKVFDQAPPELQIVTFKMMASDNKTRMKFVKYPSMKAIFDKVKGKMKNIK